MTDLLGAAYSLQAELDRFQLPNCIIGGLALQAWGEIRLTRDVDFTVFCGIDLQEEQVEQILSTVKARIPNSLDFAMANRIVLGLIHGVPVDIALAAFDYEKRCIDRALAYDFGNGAVLRICAAEDLIIMKTFAGREQDLRDVEGIVVRRNDKLNWDLVQSELEPLLELAGGSERMGWLAQLRSSAAG